MSGLDVRTFTVGVAAENTYLLRAAGSDHALLIDPGAEAPRLIDAIEQLGVAVDAILITHTHFDHVGAVAPLARHTAAPVYCPTLERDVLADLERYVQATARATGMDPSAFGPLESYEATELLAGGEHLALAGLEIDVDFTPGHSPGHLTYAVADPAADPSAHRLFSGDVLFAGSVGRVDLPGGDWPTLAASIAGLLDGYPDETLVHAGHMSLTTLGRERATNPFLAGLPGRAAAAG